MLVLHVAPTGDRTFSKVTSAVVDGRKKPAPKGGAESGPGWPDGGWWGGATIHLTSIVGEMPPGVYAIHVRRLPSAEEQAEDVARAQVAVAHAKRKASKKGGSRV